MSDSPNTPRGDEGAPEPPSPFSLVGPEGEDIGGLKPEVEPPSSDEDHDGHPEARLFENLELVSDESDESSNDDTLMEQPSTSAEKKTFDKDEEEKQMSTSDEGYASPLPSTSGRNPPNALMNVDFDKKSAKKEADVAAATVAALEEVYRQQNLPGPASGAIPRRIVEPEEREDSDSGESIVVLSRDIGSESTKKIPNGYLEDETEPEELVDEPPVACGQQNNVQVEEAAEIELPIPPIEPDTFEFVTNMLAFIGTIGETNVALGITANMKIEWARLSNSDDDLAKQLVLQISRHVRAAEFTEAESLLNILRLEHDEPYFTYMFRNLIRLRFA